MAYKMPLPTLLTRGCAAAPDPVEQDVAEQLDETRRPAGAEPNHTPPPHQKNAEEKRTRNRKLF